VAQIQLHQTTEKRFTGTDGRDTFRTNGVVRQIQRDDLGEEGSIKKNKTKTKKKKQKKKKKGKHKGKKRPFLKINRARGLALLMQLL
jgi:hypothetical protein